MDAIELKAWLRLSLTVGIGNTSARKLLVAFGLPKAVFEQSEAALESVVSSRQAQALLQIPPELQELTDATCQWLEGDAEHRRFIPLGDACYPKSLLQMEDPPLLLYALGAPFAWAPSGLADCMQRSVAIVGSRNPTPQGVENARQFGQALAQAGLTVVSGMALGIDGAAHEGALAGANAGQLSTIAVVGTGLDRVYPKQHRDLAHRIAESGVILSEYPIGTPPLSANFPKRNRLISGLSTGTLVVEAALKSGSLITARMALEQGKDVFAIPGSIHSTQARGCHALIKQGAKLVEDAQDILEELGALVSQTGPDHAPNVEDLDRSSPLLEAMGFDPVGLDALQARTGLDTASLQVELMTLELAGTVARLPGGLFQRSALT